MTTLSPGQVEAVDELRGLRSDLRVEISIKADGKIFAQAMWTHDGNSHNCHAFGQNAVSVMLTAAAAAIREGKA